MLNDKYAKLQEYASDQEQLIRAFHQCYIVRSLDHIADHDHMESLLTKYKEKYNKL